MATHDVVAIVTQSDELCKIENKKFSFDVTIVFEKPSKFVKKRHITSHVSYLKIC